MRHLRLILFLFSLLGTIIGGAFWTLSQFFNEPTHAVITQTLNMSDVTIVYETIYLVSAVSAIILTLIVIIVALDKFGYHIEWKKPTTAMPSMRFEGGPHNVKQLRYREEVRTDLLRILVELCNIKEPQLIQLVSWNARPEPKLRGSDLHNETQYHAIEDLSSALNGRNNYVNKLGSFRGDQDLEFQRLNNQCFVMYEKVRDTGFLEADLPPQFRDELETYSEAVAKLKPVTYYPVIGTRRPYDRQHIPDENQSHLQAYMFYRFTYFIPILSKLMGKHRDTYVPPRERLIVNTTTNRAYPLRGTYATGLIWPIVQIAWNPQREPFPFSHLDRWCKKRERNWSFIDQTPTRADLSNQGPLHQYVH